MLTHFSTGDERTMTTGLSRQKLMAIAWREIAGLTRINRARVIADLVRHDIRPSVRVNAAALQRFKKGAKGVPVQLGELAGEILLTAEWQALRADWVNVIDFDRHESPALGAASAEMYEHADGYGGKAYDPRLTVGVPDLIEIAMPLELSELVVATS